jgi:hypothetical protein
MISHPHDPSAASAGPERRFTPSQETGTVDRDFGLLVSRGLSAVEAGNVVAYFTGLHPAEQGWTVAEIKHLLAIRWLVAAGVIAS